MRDRLYYLYGDNIIFTNTPAGARNIISVKNRTDLSRRTYIYVFKTQYYDIEQTDQCADNEYITNFKY